MIHKFILTNFSLVIFGFGSLQAQKALITSGGNASGSNGSSSYTVGQIDFSTKGIHGEITEGVQQPYEITTLATSETDIKTESIKLYPNPVDTFLYVDFDQYDFRNSSYQIFDIQGKSIKTGNFNQKKNVLDLSMLPASVYIIKISQNQKDIKIFKIIKNQ